MPEYPWQPGMILTSQRLRDAARIGAVVFSAFRGSAQTITSGTQTTANALAWDTPVLDSLGAWSASLPTRWTCTVAGWYKFDGGVGFNQNGSGTPGTTRDVIWMFNAGVESGTRNRSEIVSAAPTIVDARTFARFMAVGDYVELVPAHDASVSLTTTTGSLGPNFVVTYSGPA